jgi:tetratricopeptide (TPR) repeat protein
MVDDCLKNVIQTAKELWLTDLEANQEPIIRIVDEGSVKQKLHNFIRKFLTDLSNPKRKKSPGRNSLVMNLDVYTENQDITVLQNDLQFFVVLNWARKYYEKEDYQRAVDPLRRLLKIKPEYGLGYKWLARSLKKLRKYDEAMRYYELYAKIDQSIDALLELAKSYRKGKQFDKSEKIYQKVLVQNPEEKEARMGLAQVKYARMEEDYLPLMEALYETDPEWMKEWLNEEFNFRIYSSSKTPLTPVQAAQLLGFRSASEVTGLAFKNKIPSHFNPSMARMSFFKEEIENWARIINRFRPIDREITLHPEKITDAAEGKSNKTAELLNGDKTNEEGRTPRVEEIIRKIREARTQRENIRNTFEKSPAGKKHKSSGNRGNGSGRQKNSPDKNQDDIREMMVDDSKVDGNRKNRTEKSGAKTAKPKKRRTKSSDKNYGSGKSREVIVSKDEKSY